jgi:phosphoglycolate phosphatase
MSGNAVSRSSGLRAGTSGRRAAVSLPRATPILAWVLILFDIDGTLLLGTPRAHTEAFVRAAGEVFGVTVTVADVTAIAPAGRTDREIARLVLRRAAVPDARIDRGMTPWVERLAELYPEYDAVHPAQIVAPGADAALTGLAGRGASLALLTGNIEALAHAKMARAGLSRHFARGQGAFGSDHESRDALVPIAARRAGGATTVVVVGDTPRDIACARAGGARCVAVTTGVHDAAALHDADAVVDGMEGAAEVISGWL